MAEQDPQYDWLNNVEEGQKIIVATMVNPGPPTQFIYNITEVLKVTKTQIKVKDGEFVFKKLTGKCPDAGDKTVIEYSDERAGQIVLLQEKQKIVNDLHRVTWSQFSLEYLRSIHSNVASTIAMMNTHQANQNMMQNALQRQKEALAQPVQEPTEPTLN